MGSLRDYVNASSSLRLRVEYNFSTGSRARQTLHLRLKLNSYDQSGLTCQVWCTLGYTSHVLCVKGYKSATNHSIILLTVYLVHPTLVWKELWEIKLNSLPFRSVPPSYSFWTRLNDERIAGTIQLCTVNYKYIWVWRLCGSNMK